MYILSWCEKLFWQSDRIKHEALSHFAIPSEILFTLLLIFTSTHQTSTRAFEHPGFVIRLVLDGSDIKFEPTFPDFEVVLLNVYDVMIKSVSVIPRVETKLYSEWVSLCLHITIFWFFFFPDFFPIKIKKINKLTNFVFSFFSSWFYPDLSWFIPYVVRCHFPPRILFFFFTQGGRGWGKPPPLFF